jgi:hypothetical protein
MTAIKRKPEVKVKKKGDGSRTVHLDNGIVVKVKRLSEQEQLRAAATFNPKSISRISRSNQNMVEGMDLWKGNEAYLLFVVERSCTLLSEMPDPATWLGPYRRNWRSYGIEYDELDDPTYIRAIYIRFEGITTDHYVSVVTEPAMGVKATVSQNGVEPEAEVEIEPVIEEEDEEEDEDDDS